MTQRELLMSDVFFGIAFGSKLAGTTVVAMFRQRRIFFMDVDEGVDADQFILNAADHFKPTLVFIDAPLSLPGRYTGLPGCEDYHLRKADQEVCALSPMFLGGLTARAIHLKHELEARNITVMETYPKIMAKRYALQTIGYKADALHLQSCRTRLKSALNPDICLDCADVTTWHHLDALLSLMSAMNHANGTAQHFGDEREGQIVV